MVEALSKIAQSPLPCPGKIIAHQSIPLVSCHDGSGHDLAMALRGAYFAMHRQTNAVMARFDLTADQFVVLAALGQGDTLTQKELGSRTDSDPNTLRPMLARLESKGLIKRSRHPTDGRALSVLMTPRGKKLLATLLVETDPIRDQLLGALNPVTLVTLLDQLQQIVATLKRKGLAQNQVHEGIDNP